MLKVVIRVALKRPPNFKPEIIPVEFSGGTWTPEKDKQLWRLLLLYGPNDKDWNFIASQLGITTEECIERSSLLFQQQLASFQQDLVQKQIPEIKISGNMTTKKASPSRGEVENDYELDEFEDAIPISRSILNEAVHRHNFDWLEVARELGRSPQYCRDLYQYYEEKKRVF